MSELSAGAIAAQGSAAGKHKNRLKIVLATTTTYMLAEAVGGYLTNSLALLADAAHMLTDVFGISLALFAIWFGSRAATREHTYGFYRTEILAALLNAVVLFFISGYILFEAWRRFQQPPDVLAGPMLIVASIGLAVNIFAAWLLHGSAAESLNMKGAFLEVVSDLLGSVGVIVAALIILFTGWPYADPIFSVAIGLFIIPRTWSLLKESVGILLEGTPSHINLAEVESAVLEVEGVRSVHDLHVWTITSGLYSMSSHVGVAPGADPGSVLPALQSLLKDRFQLTHTTIQIDPDGSRCEENAF